MNPEITEPEEATPTTNAVSLFGQGGGPNDFPVLKAFQEYIDAEQAKARKRMLGLCVFFILLLVVIVVTFTVVISSVTPAEGFSVSFPRISPDGRFLCFTRHGFGNFSIWHKDADLWLVDLADGSVRPMENVNSDDVESFHTWNSDGKWLVLSSRRDDGLYTKPYFTHIDEEGNCTKPFLLPQKDPVSYYKRLMKSYNLPAFTTGKVSVSKRKLTDVLRKSPGTDVTPR